MTELTCQIAEGHFDYTGCLSHDSMTSFEEICDNWSLISFAGHPGWISIVEGTKNVN